jgi:hypothetical protein
MWHCHWGVEWWRRVVEQWLPEVVVGNGGDTHDREGVVVMMVVIQLIKKKGCLLFVMWQTPTNISELTRG